MTVASIALPLLVIVVAVGLVLWRLAAQVDWSALVDYWIDEPSTKKPPDHDMR